ncbi:hypothetical protein XS22_001891 [Salmonella enterica subsp. enterica]|nr:hypothetical protein [Salmonella enterica subsp. enterica serovar Poona]
MTTNNHPAHGPVSLHRLHQISEILSKAAAQSDGGNLGYAMADAVKVIDGVLNAEPVAYIGQRMLEDLADGARSCGRVWSVVTDEMIGESRIPLYTAPPAPVMPDIDTMALNTARNIMCDINRMEGWPGGDVQLLACIQSRIEQACRPAMLQAGNHTEQHLDMVDHSGDANKMVAGNSQVTPGCWCRTCRPVTMSDMRFVVCHECGNKRCPRANDHRNDCTGSNEPGQIGSAYQAAPQQEVK